MGVESFLCANNSDLRNRVEARARTRSWGNVSALSQRNSERKRIRWKQWAPVMRGTAEAWRQRAEVARGQASKLLFQPSPGPVRIAGEGQRRRA